jgi:hypothetical protein
LLLNLTRLKRLVSNQRRRHAAVAGGLNFVPEKLERQPNGLAAGGFIIRHQDLTLAFSNSPRLNPTLADDRYFSRKCNSKFQPPAGRIDFLSGAF